MTDPHPSALALDALALGTLDQERADATRTHLARCSSCEALYDAAARHRDDFARRVLPRGLPQRARWRWIAVPALALAVVVALWVRTRPPEQGDLRLKGTASWQVFAHRDGHTFAVHDGTELAAGDRIRFVVSPGGARYLLVASVDGLGAVTIYYPYRGALSAPIDGDRFELSGSIVLDRAPGPERIYALLSDVPLAAEMVAAPLRAVASGGATAIRATPTLPVPVRAQASLVFEKAQP